MTIVLRNDLAELERVSQGVSEFWTQHNLPAELEGDLSLALEEILANIIMHGYGDREEHQIVVRLESAADEIQAFVEDDGVAFNPLNAPEPDLTSPLEQRRIGGLGLHLVRNLMDVLNYERRGDRNHFRMTKRLGLP